MYIQMTQAPCSRQDEMRRLVDDWSSTMADRPGWLGGTYGFTDDGRFVAVERWEDEDAHRTLVDEAGADAWWKAGAELCDAPPEIHQSGNVTIMLEGGSDSAGFVQVMHGKIMDRELLEKFHSDEMVGMLHEARPEIIGATMIFEDDGTFTETIAFTDEAAARKGETLSMPAEVSEEMDRAMAEVTYTDLHAPFFHSHH